MNLSISNAELSLANTLSSNNPEDLTQLPPLPSLSPQQQAELQDQEAKQQRFDKILATVTELEKTFPECFNLSAPKPLKVGILEDLYQIPSIMEGISKAIAKDAIKYYVYKRKYRKAIVKGEWRYDLQGNQCQIIEPSHKADAQTYLDKKPAGKK